ncbi:MAG: ABC transporter permease [Solirubrobacteraceae bacterium]
MRFGLALTGALILLAIVGPWIAPHSPAQLVGPPFSPPSSTFLLGTDYIGRDILSRVLCGGRTVIGLSLLATVLGVSIGAVVGMAVVFCSHRADTLVMGVNDVILSIPQIVLVLVFVSIAGPKLWLIVLLVALSHSPRVMRLTRSVAAEMRRREFVEFAALTGLSRRRIAFQEIMPNLATPLLIEFGIRLAWSVGIIAGLSFIGYGIQAPTADWGLMINENRGALTIQVFAVLAPIVCIFLFTIGTNLMTEGIARAAGRSERVEL